MRRKLFGVAAENDRTMSTSTEVIEQLANTEYKYGFITDVEQEIVPKGLSEDVIRLISAKKEEPGVRTSPISLARPSRFSVLALSGSITLTKNPPSGMKAWASGSSLFSAT